MNVIEAAGEKDGEPGLELSLRQLMELIERERLMGMMSTSTQASSRGKKRTVSLLTDVADASARYELIVSSSFMRGL